MTQATASEKGEVDEPETFPPTAMLAMLAIKQVGVKANDAKLNDIAYWKRTAVHEAGHVLMAHYFGIPIIAIELYEPMRFVQEPETGQSLLADGHTIYRPHLTKVSLKNPEDLREKAVQWFMMRLAGSVAHHLYTGVTQDEHGMSGDLGKCEAFIHKMGLDEAQAKAWFTEALQKSRDYLSRNWKAVTTLAAHLVNRPWDDGMKRLIQDEIRWIIEVNLEEPRNSLT